MKTATCLLGAYQVLAGVCSLASLWATMFERGPLAVTVLVLFAALAIIAGLSMWFEKASGWQLTICNQLIQVIGIYSPWLSFTVIHGASISVLSHCYAKATFGDSIFKLGGSSSVGTSVCDVFSGRALVALPTYGISLNLLALLILIYSIGARNRANQPSEPTSGLRPAAAHL